MKRTIALIGFACVAAGLWAAGQTGAEPTDNEGQGPAPAIQGYDPVAFFTQSEAIQGSSEFALEHDGILWHFVSLEHQSLFAADPTQYMPWFGRYCANGLSDKHLIDANPEHWLIDDERLFLFFSARGRRTWVNGDIDAEFNQAQAYYRETLGNDAAPGDPAGYQ